MKTKTITQILLLFFTFTSTNVFAEEQAIKSAAVEMKNTTRYFRLDGKIEAVNKSTISARTAGVVKEVLFDVDDFVKQGAVIAILTDSLQQEQLTQAEANMAEIKAHLSEVKKEQRRVLQIFEKKLISQAKMDSANTALMAAEEKLKAAIAGHNQAKEQLSYTIIKAPYSGIVTERHIQVGEAAHTGSPIMTGVSLDELRIKVTVPQSLIASVRHYKQALVDINSASVKVDDITIFPFADPKTATFTVRIDLPEGVEGLFPGMFIKVALVTGAIKNIVIPTRAVAHRSEVTAVYVINKYNQLSFRHIRLGTVSGGNVTVLSGLRIDEKIALDPIVAGSMLIEQRTKKIANGVDK